MNFELLSTSLSNFSVSFSFSSSSISLFQFFFFFLFKTEPHKLNRNQVFCGLVAPIKDILV